MFNDEDTWDFNKSFNINSSPIELENRLCHYDLSEKENHLNQSGDIFNINTNDNTNEINNIMNPENITENNQNNDLLLQYNENENNFQEEQKTIELNEEDEENKFVEKNESIKMKQKENKKLNFICKKKNCGRKTNKDKIKGKKGSHTKESEDNIMRKIKSFFQKRIHKYLSKITKEDLLKLDSNVKSRLKKEFNLNLFNKTLKDIYIETNISPKYKLKKVKTNEKLINRIYKEEKEIEAIKILNLTYEEAFEIFRRNLKPKEELSDELKRKIAGTNILNPKFFEDASVLIENEKEEGKTQDNMKYIDNFRRLILEFKNWFENKIGRNR